MIDLAGQTFGNYKAENQLGKGGFADVYFGRHMRNDNDRVAIKVLHDRLTDKKSKETFLNEANILRRLNHPGIVRLCDYDIRSDGVAYLVMEFAPNSSLDKKYVTGWRPTLSEVVSYIKQTAEALQYAHGMKVVHCDIKPENLLLGSEKQIVIGDFGIAKIVQNTRNMETGEPIGTIEFMPPEQIQGKPRSASDQYALAIVVYLWLTGSLPFTGPYGVVLMHQWKIEPPPLRNRVPDLPVAVERVVLKALSKETNDRYVNIQAFAAALEQAIQPGQPNRPFAPPIPPVSPPANKSVPQPNRSPVQPVPNRPAPQPNRPPVQPATPAPNRPPVRQHILSEAQELVNRGNNYFVRKMYVDAIEAYDGAIRLVPGYVDALNHRGKTKNELWRWEDAIKDFDRVIRLDPEHDWAYSNRGFAYLGLKQYEQAITDCEHATKLNHHEAKMYLYCGLAHELQGKHGPVSKKIEHFAKAIDNYDAALSWEPFNVQARGNRTRLYHLLNSLRGGQ